MRTTLRRRFRRSSARPKDAANCGQKTKRKASENMSELLQDVQELALHHDWFNDAYCNNSVFNAAVKFSVHEKASREQMLLRIIEHLLIQNDGMEKRMMESESGRLRIYAITQTAP